MKIAKQFVGDTMWVTLSMIAIMHALAFFVRGTGFELPLLIIFGLFTLVMTWRSPVNGLLIAFAEIFVGGHGHLLDVDVVGFSLSIRVLIFAIVMAVWLVRFIQNRAITFVPVRDVPWLILILSVFLGALIGFTQNDPSIAFDDMNGYVVIGYFLPILTIKWDQIKKRQLLQALFASMLWVVGFTIALAYAFTHINGDNLHNLYTFVRDSRLAEVTLQVVGSDVLFLDQLAGDYWYRIFMPGQSVVMFGLLLGYAVLLNMWRKAKSPWFIWVVLCVSVLTILLSLSRSFMLGSAIGGISLFVSAWNFGKGKWSILTRTIGFVITSMIAIVVIVGLVQIPVPKRPDFTDAAFFETSSETGRSEAVVSRWNLLDPMMDEIYNSPIVGSGFGEEVSYQSEDPRVLEQENGGVYTTYRFEWGWQDIWLKMGLLGLLAFGWYFVSLMRVGWFTAQNKGYKWLVLGLMAGITALFVTHVFSPYLNHPIGLGFMLFVLPFIDWEGWVKKHQKVARKTPSQKLVKQPASVATSQLK